MGTIKSSLELAIERTAGIAASKDSVALNEYRQQGKKLVGQLLDGEQLELDGVFKDLTDAQRTALCTGIGDVLLPLITLPTEEEHLERFQVLGTLLAFLGFADTSQVVQSLEQLGYGYLQEKQQIIVAVRHHFGAVAMQQAAQIQRQTGMGVHVDPSSLPEFQQELQKNLSQLNSRVQPQIDAIKSDLQQFFATL